MKLPASTPRLAGLAAIGVQLVREAQAQSTISAFGACDGWRLNAPPSLAIAFDLEAVPLLATLQSDQTQISARVEGDHAIVVRRHVHLQPNGAGWSVTLSYANHAATILVDGHGAYVIEAGEAWRYPFARAISDIDAHDAGDELKANLPGKIVSVTSQSGQAIKKGEVLIVLEAMKMEHSLAAPRDGVIAEMLVAIGRQVRAGEILLRLAPQTDVDI
jgi:acetyl/propionyl-CoA carboxylase alpha subunit